MTKSIQFYTDLYNTFTQGNISIEKLHKRCDHSILLHISGRMDPLRYVSHFALESEYDEIRHCCADKDTSALSINLCMLFKWKERKGSEATYQALLEIFKQANDEKMIDFILKYAENGHTTHSFESVNLMFPKVNSRDDIPELEKKYAKITTKFAIYCEQIIQSLEKTRRPRDLAYYLSNAHHLQFESTDDITDIIANISSWFNVKLLKILVNRYGNDKDKASLLHYEQDLLAYLQQSLFHIPANSFQSSNDASNVTLCYLKIPEEDIELLDLSGEDVLQIERNLADYLGIPHEVFNLCEYRLGCIELVFSIPTTLYKSNNCTLQKSTEPGRFVKDKNKGLRLTVDLKDVL